MPDVVALDVTPADRPPWMCSAHLRDGSGTLCRKPRMIAQRVCSSHGGQAPQNLEAAWKRLREWTDPVLAELINTAMAPSGSCPTCGRQADALRLRAQIAIVDRAMDARLPVEASADTSASDVLLTFLSDAEHEALFSLYTLGRERMARGEAPQGGAVRSVIVPPLADRIHQIVRVIVHPPAYDAQRPSNGRDEPRGDE